MVYDMFIFHGHGDGDVGACSNGYKEIDIAQSIQRKVLTKLSEYDINIHYNNGENNYNKDLTNGHTYREKFGIIIHVNSGGGKGCEALVPLNESYFTLEQNILARLENIGFKNRGIKSRDFNTDLFVARQHYVKCSGTDWYKEIRQCWNRKVSATILEIGFIDNKEDLNLMLGQQDKIASIIAEEIIRYLNLKKSVNNVCPTCGK